MELIDGEVGVKTSFKNTEVGLVPKDWEVKKLMELSSKISVGIASSATHAYRDKGIPLLRNQNIKNGSLDDTDILYVDEAYEESYRNKRLKEDDLITARTGYPGATCIVPKKYDGAQSFTTLITRPYKDLVWVEYLNQYINSSSGQSFFETNQIGGGQKNVNAGTLKLMPIPLPPTLAEQRAIATALSDVDALIRSIGELIDKKRAIKQGAMQELLTGRRRLPAFVKSSTGGEGFKKIKLGEVLRIRHGKSQREVVSIDGDYPILGTGGEIGRAKEFLYDKPSVLIGRKGTIDVPRYLDTPFWTVDTLFYSEISEKAVPKFLFYRFCLIDWYSYNEASGVPSLNASTIEKIEIELPPLEEQRAIGQILSDMDAEIAALQEKQAKYRSIKQGMMQELLTGKTRLI